MFRSPDPDLLDCIVHLLQVIVDNLSGGAPVIVDQKRDLQGPLWGDVSALLDGDS